VKLPYQKALKSSSSAMLPSCPQSGSIPDKLRLCTVCQPCSYKML
jgi:hypothetical protein